MKKRFKRQKGQAVVEYVIIVVVVALAALVVLGAFSDRIRDMMNGVTRTLGGDENITTETNSLDQMKSLDSDGLDTGGN
tara:strand:+ start:283 stop:519 length:237 start_codon:yes stop_codon:yes gene_type:complete